MLIVVYNGKYATKTIFSVLIHALFHTRPSCDQTLCVIVLGLYNIFYKVVVLCSESIARVSSQRLKQQVYINAN